MVQKSKHLYMEICVSGCSWTLVLGIEDVRTAFACLLWLVSSERMASPKASPLAPELLTTSVAAALGCFRLSHRLPTMFFRSRLNFILCLDSGVGKGGLGCL